MVRRRGDTAYGVTTVDGGGSSTVAAWDLDTGAMRDVCSVPNTNSHHFNLTRGGDVVAVSIYGEFTRYDSRTGALRCSRRLDTDSVGRIDCLRRIDRRRLLGTPFITQRFFEVNLDTGAGTDCGRAAPGGNEILQTWRLRGKIYMAAYAGGELTKYDPARPANFPETPRVVAAPPHATRPNRGGGRRQADALVCLFEPVRHARRHRHSLRCGDRRDTLSSQPGAGPGDQRHGL